MTDEKELIVSVADDAEIVELKTDTAKLMQIALAGGSVDQLEKLIELKNREEEREAKKVFDLHFAEMQAEFQPVKRMKKTDKAAYAPIEHLQKQYGHTIAAHGFSYRWSEENGEEGRLRVLLHISGWGFEKVNQKELPAYKPEAKIMNPLQAEGTRSTYGRRYTFISGFGLIIEDEDDDGASFGDGVKYGAMISQLNAETHTEDLHAMAKKFREELKAAGDPRGVEIITKAYAERKEQLQ